MQSMYTYPFLMSPWRPRQDTLHVEALLEKAAVLRY